MATYEIKKTNNGEYKEIEKKFTLDVNKYIGHSDTLYFNVEGEEIPVIFDLNLFLSIMLEQIEKGLMENLEYKDGTIIATVRDGNTIKKYTYDFAWEQFKGIGFTNGGGEALDALKTTVYKIVSFFNESPNKALMSEQRYLRMIFDIIDGDRLPKIENRDEILRVFQVYHANKAEILTVLLQNVVFYDDNDNVIEYGKFLKARQLDAVKYDILSQMEIKMLMFAVNNNAYDLYQEYNSKTTIPRVEIEYKYVDENGNEIESPIEEVEAGNLFTVGRELVKKGLTGVKDLAVTGAGIAANGATTLWGKAQEALKKVKERKRTR